ncbi:MAG: NAD(P)H-dependent oxidoreductase [Bacteroidota bacterium]
MITVISGTNNKNNKTQIFAHYAYEYLKTKADVQVKYLALDQIEHDYFFPAMYKSQASSLAKLQDEYILPAQKFVIVSPEYNGGVSGALKLFLDACSVREYSATFKGKKAALIGVASGRAGNLRGMGQLSQILNHVGTIVFPNQLPISSIGKLLNEENEITSTATTTALQKQLDGFLDF